jgi:hypothetical protein
MIIIGVAMGYAGGMALYVLSNRSGFFIIKKNEKQSDCILIILN